MSESEMPVCPQCERSDMVRLYYEHYCCERCCVWLQDSVEWEKRRSKPVAVAEAPTPSDPVSETAQKEDVQAPAAEASAPRRKGKSSAQTWECPSCRAQYPQPKGAGVCPACAMGENPETVALVPLEEGT